jgi:hypothetical protein
MKGFLKTVSFFLLFAFLGGFFRFGWFYTHQKAVFERKIAFKELADSKLGGKTPQETWNLYLDALEKGDIELAVQYWVPEARVGIGKIMKEYKNAGVLQRYVKNHGGNLTKEKSAGLITLKDDEKAFSYDYIKEKEIDFIGARGEYRNILEKIWKDEQMNNRKTRPIVIFQLNKFTNKWLIKQ